MENFAEVEAEDESDSLMEEKDESSRERSPLIRGGGVKAGSGSREEVGRGFEAALDGVGVGLFHVVLIVVAGWALASDSVEVQCISFVTPQLSNQTSELASNATIQPDIILTKVEEGVLDAMIFLGMMFGGYIWGAWSDVVGRRSCLLTSLSVNGVFGLASALSPTYAWFLVFRFGSGVGVGGSIPVAFSYFGEFFTRKRRGPFIIVLAGFWVIGQLYASVLAWVMFDHVSVGQQRLGSIHLQTWRIYILLCTVPCLSSAVALACLPESPAFLFTKGKEAKAVRALEFVLRMNRCCAVSAPSPTVRRQLSQLASPEATKGTNQPPKKSFWKKVTVIFDTTIELFSLSYLRATLVLLTVWFCLSFGYYGLLLWFPEYFKCVHEETADCYYELAHSCAVNASRPCNSTSSIYLDSLYASLATIPGTLLGILTVNLIGAKSMLSISVILCGLSTFLIWVVPKTEALTVLLSCLFSGVSIVGWNALDVISTSELFPVHLRSTSIGIQAVAGRIGAILGNLAFGRLITVSPYIPILMVAAMITFGGVMAVLIPSTRPSKRWPKMINALCRLCFRKQSRTSSPMN